MLISINLPHVFAPGSSPRENADALRELLECLIGLNIAFLRCHKVRPLYKSGVFYKRTEVWDTIPGLYQRGYGDCKSLSAALIAQLRFAGALAEPNFRFVQNSSGGTDYHILVQTSTGFEDPSKVLGMLKDENFYFTRG